MDPQEMTAQNRSGIAKTSPVDFWVGAFRKVVLSDPGSFADFVSHCL